MKGQYFIIGSLLICILLFFGFPPEVAVRSGSSGDLDFLASNLASEFPRALNAGINASSPAAVLGNFTVFSRQAALARGINLTCLWLVFERHGASMNVSAGNYMGHPVTVGINLSGAYAAVYAGADAVNSTAIGISGYWSNLTVAVGQVSARGALLHNKTSVYASFYVTRGDDTVRIEILA